MRLSIFLPVLFLLFGGGILLYSLIALGDITDFGAGFMPAIIGCLIVLLSVLDFIISWMKSKKEKDPGIPVPWRDLASVGMISIAVIFYIFFVDTLGFILTSSAIIISLLLLFLKKNKIIASIAAIGISTGIYYLFAKILLVPLPSGSFF
ncbi:hypothetical protein BIY29_07850 [Brenneria alni]|uniref:DUF1468 domain-containing protein n=1 Tax=Brenneria alni TaxID=71656 RepID=A0A421DQ37_9GAMM|nr:tripartite tricarboxylate transporter TctB family protein [Brenneria alni]RLM25170.1 hypothetical protein BIY29_07850 [Brenneria alni]